MAHPEGFAAIERKTEASPEQNGSIINGIDTGSNASTPPRLNRLLFRLPRTCSGGPWRIGLTGCHVAPWMPGLNSGKPDKATQIRAIPLQKTDLMLKTVRQSS